MKKRLRNEEVEQKDLSKESKQITIRFDEFEKFENLARKVFSLTKSEE